MSSQSWSLWRPLSWWPSFSAWLSSWRVDSVSAKAYGPGATAMVGPSSFVNDLSGVDTRLGVAIACASSGASARATVNAPGAIASAFADGPGSEAVSEARHRNAVIKTEASAPQDYTGPAVTAHAKSQYDGHHLTVKNAPDENQLNQPESGRTGPDVTTRAESQRTGDDQNVQNTLQREQPDQSDFEHITTPTWKTVEHWIQIGLRSQQ